MMAVSKQPDKVFIVQLNVAAGKYGSQVERKYEGLDESEASGEALERRRASWAIKMHQY
jgi:hypothetical protein